MAGAAAPSFFCPLTMAMMKDPVQDREGHSYEKEAIMQWLAKNETSPITRNRLRRKHLVPNRALKEAIDFEATKNNPLSSNHHRRGTWSYSTSPTVIPTSPEESAFASVRCTPNHHHALNNFLSTLDDEYRLDCFGSAFLPMNFDGQAGKMLLVIEAPNNKDTFRLYTHFNGNIERCKESTTPTANRVLSNLLRHGKHKSLTLANVCDERMRFSFEEKNSEISSEANVKNVLDMFVKVSFRMKKIIEAASPQSRNISSALVLPPARTNSASDSSTAAIAVPFEDCPESSLRQAQFALGCRSVSESGRSHLSTGKIASSSAGYSSVTERAGHLSPPPRTQDLSSCCAFYLK